MKQLLHAFSLVSCVAALLAVSATAHAMRASNLRGGAFCQSVSDGGELCDSLVTPIDYSTHDAMAGVDPAASYDVSGGAANGESNFAFASHDDAASMSKDGAASDWVSNNEPSSYKSPGKSGFDLRVQGVPEPSTFLLLGTGLFFAAGLIRHWMSGETMSGETTRGETMRRQPDVATVAVVEVRQRAA